MDKRVNIFNSTISASLERLLRAKKEDEYVNFDDVCRSCLSSKNELTNIHQISLGGLSVAEVFDQYMAIKVEDQDDLPQNLCTMCLYEVCRVYLFINNCREADTKLKELVLKVQSGDEEVYHESIVTTENNDTTGWNMQDNTNDLLQMGPIKVTEPGPPFICNNCSESFSTLSEIKMHRTLHKHYIMRQYLCRICNPSKVYSYRHWRNHMRVHTGEKPYECHICGKKFSVPGNRERHILTHTGEKPYKCDQCDKAFSQSTNLKHHKLRAHMGQKLEREKGHFECKHCQKVFSTRGSLAHHTVIHYDKKFLCNECGKSFHYKIQFNMHMDSHRGIRRYKCNICDKAFARPISLGLHKRTHTGHKPYECRYCDKRFSQKAHLVSHIRTHTGERPYSCPYCEKTFALNGNLTVHIRKHTGENPYVCDICSKGFPDSSSMKNHRKKHVVNLYDMLN